MKHSKKIILFLLVTILFSLNNNSLATDSCIKIVLQKISFVGESTFAANLRNTPCTYNSTVYRASKVGENFDIVGKVDGWYKVKLADNEYGWIWDKSINKVSDNIISEEETKKEEIIKYNLNSNDYKIIDKINIRVENIIKKGGNKYIPKIIRLLKRALKKYSVESRTYRILEEVINNTQKIETEKEEANLEVNKEENIDTANEKFIGKFDLEKVRQKWLEWQNTERLSLGLSTYSYDSKLDKTTKEWSNINKIRGNITHKRDLSDSYYDYNKITMWFKERGVVCENIDRITHSESIGYSFGQCNSTDCTENLIAGAKRIFDYYMSEKGQSYDAHYRAISNKLFSKIGFGIDIEKIGNNNYKYYFTTHYCTKLID